MNYEQIAAFLTVVSYGSITGAANHMYLSQSTVSGRIRALEEELGTPLIIRGKGMRSIELTSYGAGFIPIAEQWAALYKDTQALRLQQNLRVLHIAAVDAVNSFTFAGLYEQMIRTYPQIKLTVSTHHSDEIYALVENRTADIGLVFSEISYPNITARPIYRELMYVVCHKQSGYEEGMALSSLPQEKEIYLNWGPDFAQWHDRHWPVQQYPLLTVNTGNMLQHYLHEPDRWAIAPMSVIQAIQGDDLIAVTPEEAPPFRICYEITNRHPNFSRTEAISAFEQEMFTYVKASGSVCMYEEWMKDR